MFQHPWKTLTTRRWQRRRPPSRTFTINVQGHPCPEADGPEYRGWWRKHSWDRDCVKRFHFHQKPWHSPKPSTTTTMMAAIDLSLALRLCVRGKIILFCSCFLGWFFSHVCAFQIFGSGTKNVLFKRAEKKNKQKELVVGGSCSYELVGVFPFLFLTKPSKCTNVPKISQSMAFDNKIMP